MTTGEFYLSAEKRLPLVGDSRHEVVRAIGTYEYVEGGVRFTARNGDEETFLFDEWRIELSPHRIGAA